MRLSLGSVSLRITDNNSLRLHVRKWLTCRNDKQGYQDLWPNLQQSPSRYDGWHQKTILTIVLSFGTTPAITRLSGIGSCI